jgi:molybdopterin-guanine dinucleotide biosynthesis protein A
VTGAVSAAVILAGGENKRYPSLKAFIEVDGSPLIARTLSILRGLFDQVLISTNIPGPYFALGVPLIGDVLPSVGPMSGIYSTLRYTGHDRIFVVACDMPFLTQDLIRLVCEQDTAKASQNTVQATVPVCGDDPQPLLAVYHSTALPQMEASILGGKTSMKRFLDEIGAHYIAEHLVRQVDPAGMSFANINTISDYDKIISRL